MGSPKGLDCTGLIGSILYLGKDFNLLYGLGVTIITVQQPVRQLRKQINPQCPKSP